MTRRLVLLRHAKSDWPPGVPDEERPLAERGVRDAVAVGELLAGDDALLPDLVLHSSARRARETWAMASRAWDTPPPALEEPELYGADADELIGLVAGLDAGLLTVVLVGHEPAMSTTATKLAGSGSSAEELERLKEKFPTSGVAVLRFEGDWSGVAPGAGVLERFEVPRG
jgi:phosphohistidine phosphatase